MAEQLPPVHLANAARTLRDILARRDPEHSYVVQVEGDPDTEQDRAPEMQPADSIWNPEAT